MTVFTVGSSEKMPSASARSHKMTNVKVVEMKCTFIAGVVKLKWKCIKTQSSCELYFYRKAPSGGGCM